jgi:hypothetical protein
LADVARNSSRGCARRDGWVGRITLFELQPTSSFQVSPPKSYCSMQAGITSGLHIVCHRGLACLERLHALPTVMKPASSTKSGQPARTQTSRLRTEHLQAELWVLSLARHRDGAAISYTTVGRRRGLPFDITTAPAILLSSSPRLFSSFELF